ncbi:MAG: YfhO family protein [Planctomycetaceae bacterium]|nr:YfhO family protein [Planctomycetaceae bacterium]
MSDPLISTPPAERWRRHLTAWSLVAAAFLLCVLAWPLLTGRVYTADDLGAFHLPLRAFYAQQLAKGEPYDWMPGLYSGFYMTGEGQAGVYHPLHQVLYRFLPLRTALGCEYLLSYPLMLLGVWLWLERRLQCREAAVFGGLLFTFSSFNLLHFVHPNAVAIIAHIPWLLLAIDIVLTDSRRRKIMCATAAVALLTGSQLLLGYPQYVWISLITEVSYSLFLLWTYRYAAKTGCDSRATCQGCIGCTTQTWPRLVMAKEIGVLLGAVQLLPTLDAWLHSTRLGATSDFASWGSLHPLNLLQLVSPYLLAGRVMEDNAHEFALYVGAVPLVLAAWLVTRHRDLGLFGPLVRAAAGFALAAVLLAIGQYGPLYRLMCWLPVLRSFRLPCRYLVLLQLAAAGIAAIGLILLMREGAAARNRNRPVVSRRFFRGLWRDFKPVWAVVGVAVAVALLGIQLRKEPYIAPLPAIFAGPALIVTAAVLVVAAARGFAPALVGLIVLAACDLGWYGMSTTVYPQSARLGEFVEAVSAPPGVPNGRVVACALRSGDPGIHTGDQMVLRGWRRADGYAGLEPQRQLDYRALPALQAAGVRWVRRDLTAADLPGLKPYDESWAEVPDPLPRVRLVTRCKPSADPAADIEKISLTTTALCDASLTAPTSKPGRAALISERPGRLEIDVECRSPQLLVVAESYHAGWHASADGCPTQVHRVNGDFLGCLVESGKHRVILSFQPKSLEQGWLTSWIGLALVSLCFLGWAGAPELTLSKENVR